MYVKQKAKRVTEQDGNLNSEDTSKHVLLSPIEMENANCINLSVNK
jgi:hypothetical protein